MADPLELSNTFQVSFFLFCFLYFLYFVQVMLSFIVQLDFFLYTGIRV